MNTIILTQLFLAGGKASQETEITDIKTTKQQHVLRGVAILPSSSAPENVVIYQLLLTDGREEFRTVSAKCPHQGADISRDELKADGNVYCSIHRRPICIYSEYNQAYLVEKRGERFFIVKTSP